MVSPSRTVGAARVAKHFNVTPATISNWCKKKLIPYRRIGRGPYRFVLAEVEAVFNSPLADTAPKARRKRKHPP